MNYSTIKKTGVAAALVAAMAFAETAQAQTTPTVFGGRSQYRTWTVGVQGGITTVPTVFGGSQSFGRRLDATDHDMAAYYGLTVRKQFSHLFGLELAANRGNIRTHNKGVAEANGAVSANTEVNYDVTLNGVFQLLTFDFLRRENAVNIYGKAGFGLFAYNPVQYSSGNFSGTPVFSTKWGSNNDKDYRNGMIIPVGVGAKFKLSDLIALNVGYTVNFTDENLLYGPSANDGYKQRFSNAYAGLEFALGSKSKPNLTFDNPIATLYDELKDPSLRNEVEALKQRVSTLESTVEELSKDSDGDGVPDKFDKCPGTPAGTVVDGSGCPIKFPEPVIQKVEAAPVARYAPIQFDFDSFVLKTESYATLDQLSKDLRESNASITLEGHASAEGTAEYNLQLSKDRADAVKQYLVNSGVSAARITANGYGDTRPISSNTTEQGRILNRRVEVVR